MSFFQRLEAETAAGRQALYAVPQIADALAGRITRETYLAYLTEAYHHVSQTVPLLTRGRDGMDAAHQAFRAALDAYIAEERGHEQWILADIARVGGDAEAVRAGAPKPATARMVAFARGYISRVNPMGLFGMIYVLESASTALATHGAAAVAKTLGLGPECFTYLTSHGALDQEHMRFFAGLMAQVDAPADQAAILEMARGVYGLFADMFRSIPHETELAHAV